jgi:hypothetical protein
MPIVVGLVLRRLQADHAGRHRVVRGVEQEQLDSAGLARKDAEVDTAVDDRGAERKAAARRYPHAITAMGRPHAVRSCDSAAPSFVAPRRDRRLKRCLRRLRSNRFRATGVLGRLIAAVSS